MYKSHEPQESCRPVNPILHKLRRIFYDGFDFVTFQLKNHTA